MGGRGSRLRCLIPQCLVGMGLVLGPAPALAEVRYGQGVRIGGHDVANRRSRSVHIARVRRLPGPPGCRHVRNGSYRRGDGSLVRGRMEVCNLVAIPPGQRR